MDAQHVIRSQSCERNRLDKGVELWLRVIILRERKRSLLYKDMKRIAP